jgi:hypothetical protein
MELIYPKYLCKVCGIECSAHTTEEIMRKNKLCDNHYKASIAGGEGKGKFGLAKPDHKKQKTRVIPNSYELYASKFSHREVLHKGTFRECYQYEEKEGAARVAELKEDGYFVHIDVVKQKR